MHTYSSVELKRDCEAIQIPSGNAELLPKGMHVDITQSLGGTYTVRAEGGLYRISTQNADALGLTPEAAKPETAAAEGPVDEKAIWDSLKTCFDPEIPVNIVDLGLIYDCKIDEIPGAKNSYKVEVKMTLTAPGCGMGPTLQQDVQNRLLTLENVDDVDVQLVWEPQWNQGMLTEAAKLQLGLM